MEWERRPCNRQRGSMVAAKLRNPNTNSYGYGYTYANGYSYGCTHSHPYANPHAHTFANSHTDTNRQPDTHADAHADAHAVNKSAQYLYAIACLDRRQCPYWRFYRHGKRSETSN